MKCPNCNSEFKDGMKFCPKCGAEIPQKRYCKRCGMEAKEGMLFCPKCGYSYSNSTKTKTNKTNKYGSHEICCPICNHSLAIDDQVCPSCHRELFYNCNSCKKDITYGEIIKNKGCCPKCGVKISSLYNIPDDKYPFYVEAQTPQHMQKRGVFLTGEGGQSILLKGLKIAAFCIIFLILFTYNLGMCSSGPHPTGNPAEDAKTVEKLYRNCDEAALNAFLEDAPSVYWDKYGRTGGGVLYDTKLNEFMDNVQVVIDDVNSSR